ncbi:hypothetical protein ACFL08_01895 [Patescibacteria group bacterium]
MNKDIKIFTLFSAFWIILCWIGFLLSLFDFFYNYIFLTYIILGVATGLFLFFSKGYAKHISKEFKIVIFLIALFSVFFSYFTSPTIFSGRDQGSISEAAIRLSQNNRLEFTTPASEEFFKIYGPGKALNFPGFHYSQEGTLITQFPLVYTSWLAIFYSIFGLLGLKIANSIAFSIFSISFYFIVKKLTTSSIAPWLSILFITTSFCFSWFFKFTLTENLALPLIFFGIFQLAEFTSAKNISKNKHNLVLSFLSLGLLIFTRIEGIAIFSMMIPVLLLIKPCRDFIFKNRFWTILSLLLLFLISILNLIKDINFFKEMGKALLKTELSSTSQEINILIAFSLYGIIIFFILGIVKITKLLVKKEYSKLIPLLIILPTFVYLLNPQISSDHPWMLRRFIFSILPIFILYSILLLDDLRNKKNAVLTNALVLLILLTTIPAFSSFAIFSENKNLLQQTEELSSNFSSKDLVLVDQEATGDGWSMISGPMNFILKKNSVYFFNINDFSKIDRSKFERIFIITPERNIKKYQESALGEKLNFVKDYSITTTRLNSKSEVSIPKQETILITGKIFEIK